MMFYIPLSIKAFLMKIKTCRSKWMTLIDIAIFLFKVLIINRISQYPNIN